MSVVFCAECNHIVSIFASGCRHCGAPISKARPPPSVELPPASVSPLVKAVTAVSIAGFVFFTAFNPGKGKVVTDPLRHGSYVVPQAHELASTVVRISECRYDWRSCANNRDWAESADLTGPQGACLALVDAVAGYGHIALENSWNGRRFTSYMYGTSIRQGRIVLVDRGGLARDASGGWVRTPLHCTFDLRSRQARSVSPA